MRWYFKIILSLLLGVCALQKTQGQTYVTRYYYSGNNANDRMDHSIFQYLKGTDPSISGNVTRIAGPSTLLKSTEGILIDRTSSTHNFMITFDYNCDVTGNTNCPTGTMDTIFLDENIDSICGVIQRPQFRRSDGGITFINLQMQIRTKNYVGGSIQSYGTGIFCADEEVIFRAPCHIVTGPLTLVGDLYFEYEWFYSTNNTTWTSFETTIDRIEAERLGFVGQPNAAVCPVDCAPCDLYNKLRVDLEDIVGAANVTSFYGQQLYIKRKVIKRGHYEVQVDPFGNTVTCHEEVAPQLNEHEYTFAPVVFAPPAPTAAAISTVSNSCYDHPNPDGQVVITSVTSGGQTYTGTLPDSLEISIQNGAGTDGRTVVVTVLPYSFTGLSQDTWSVVMGWRRDGNKYCNFNYGTKVVGEAPQILVSIFPRTNPTCNGGATGTITANVTGGTPPYTYTISGPVSKTETGAGNLMMSGFSAGTYSITISDSQGCNRPGAITVILTDPSAVSASVDRIHPKCTGDANGEFTIQGTGGTGPYEYTLVQFPPLPWITSGQYTNRSAGTVSYRVRDNKGCTYQDNVSLIDPPPLMLNSLVKTDPLCHGDSTGTVTLDGTGGKPDENGVYELRIDGSFVTNASLPYTFTGIGSGGQSFHFIDTNGCELGTGIFVTEPDTLTLSVDDAINPKCFGEQTGEIEVVPAGGTAPYQFSQDGLVYSATQTGNYTFSSLGQGSYTLHVRDANGCTATVQQTLTQPSLLEITGVTVDSITCFGAQDGSLTVQRSGGVEPYSYIWVKGLATVGTTQQISSLDIGTYYVTVKDANNCSEISPPQELVQPAALAFKFVQASDASCIDEPDGFIAVQVTGGTPIYSYSLDDVTYVPVAGNEYTFDGLVPGTYDIYVRDRRGCKRTQQVTVGFPVVEQEVELITGIDCAGELGEVHVTASGGVRPYTYYYTSTFNSGSSNDSVLNLPSGGYTFHVVDAKQCESGPDILNLLEPGPLLGSVQILENAACGQANGSFELTIVGGTPPYSATIRDLNQQELYNSTGATQVVEDFEGGNYNLTVEDANGCRWEVGMTLPEDIGPAVKMSVLDETYCGLPLGTLLGKVTSGGTAPFTYLWDDANATESDTLKSASPGTYALTVTDARGCQSIKSITLDDRPGVVITDIQTTQSTCGLADGTAAVTATGGNLPYTITWDDPNNQSGSSVTQLAAGTYTVTVRDVQGCEATALVTISDQGGPVLDSISSTAPFCGLATGSASGHISGGTLPVTYAWVTASSDTLVETVDVSGLLAGTYIFQVEDASGCKVAGELTLTDDAAQEPDIQVAGIDTAYCEQNNGGLQLSMSGGEAPYTYSWNGNTTDADISGLAPGFYTVLGTDNKGCRVEVTDTVPGTDRPTLSLTQLIDDYCSAGIGQLEVTANGAYQPVQYQWDHTANTNALQQELAAGTYAVFGLDDKGCRTDTLTFDLENIPGFEAQIEEAISPACFGGTDGRILVSVTGAQGEVSGTWSNGGTGLEVTDLEAGTYSVELEDTTGCSVTLEATLVAPSQLTFDAVLPYSPSCFGLCDGRIVILPEGGIAPFTFEWDDDPITEGVREDVCAGSYAVTVQDAQGCSIDTSFTVEEPAVLTGVGLVDTMTLCEGQVYTVDLSSNWTNINWTSSTGFESSDNVTLLDAEGEYWVSAENLFGCETTDTLVIRVSNDVLQTNFLVPSNLFVGDTAVLINISWPVPSISTWEFPVDDFGYEVLDSLSDRLLVLFNESGTYSFGLMGQLGDCQDEVAKTVVVFENDEQWENGDIPLGNLDHILRVNLFPNPNNGSFRIEVDLDTEADLQLQITDMIVGGKHYENLLSGSSTYGIEINLPDLAQGVYALQLTSLEESKTVLFIRQ